MVTSNSKAVLMTQRDASHHISLWVMIRSDLSGIGTRESGVRGTEVGIPGPVSRLEEAELRCWIYYTVRTIHVDLVCSRKEGREKEMEMEMEIEFNSAYCTSRNGNLASKQPGFNKVILLTCILVSIFILQLYHQHQPSPFFNLPSYRHLPRPSNIDQKSTTAIQQPPSLYSRNITMPRMIY